MLWIKALHIVFVVSWMAGLFYLPRIFVNLALETSGPSSERLLTMARKLYRFTSMLALPALLLGAWLVALQYGAKMPGWLHAKLALVLLLAGYHHARGHVFYRWFNEVPVLLLLAIVILVVVKPF
jgi:putative membrane protein